MTLLEPLNTVYKPVSDSPENKTLKILIVEDSAIDMMLLKRYMQGASLQFEYSQVDNAQEFRNLLQTDHWDLILSDYNLPGFNALGALEIVHELELDLPFIVISGALKDIDAVAIMKAGAHDFIPKENLARLIPAIDREYREAKIRQERRSLSVQLKEAKEFAELANQRKSRVLAFVAHEFKNPLKAVETFADLLDRSNQNPLSDEQKVYLQAINTACGHIRELLNDILDIAPIEAGKVDLHYTEVQLNPLLDEVILMMGPAAQKRKIKVQLDCPAEPVSMQVDAKRLRQILINLLSNAIKYTHPEDTILFKLSIQNSQVEFRIQDNGPGISVTELKNLFADYYRVKNVFSKQQEGLGLGLALTKTLVELHGGLISVESQVEQGCTFVVTLPQVSSHFAQS